MCNIKMNKVSMNIINDNEILIILINNEMINIMIMVLIMIMINDNNINENDND